MFPPAQPGIGPAMKMVFRLFFLLILSGAFVFGAKKAPPGDTDPAKELVALTLQFDNRVGGEELILNDKAYKSAAGEDFTVSQLQYFISNIRLQPNKGKEYIINPDSCYFLVQEHEPASQLIRLQVPAGDYKRVSFVLGVDSLRNTMPIHKRTGVLDPASSMDNGMYWSWNSGYIFLKIEGSSPAAPADPTGNRRFRFHIGGFGGYSAPTINNIKTVSLDLTRAAVAKPRKGRNATIVISADILKAFDGSEKLSIAAHPSVMFSEYSVKVANNYSRMFTHQRTQNQ